MRTDLERRLSNFDIFRGISLFDIERIASSAILRHVRKRHPILIEGSRAQCVYLVLSGIVKVTTSGSQPERIVVGLIGPGELFGLAAFTPERNHRYRCDAFSDCMIAEIPAEKFAELALGIPINKLRLFMALTVGRWWWGLPIWYVRSSQFSLEDRLLALLGELSRKFGVRDSRGVIVAVPITHGDLAELLGSSRTKVTGEMSRLQAEGMIIHGDRRLIVTNSLLEKLNSLVELRRLEIEDGSGEPVAGQPTPRSPLHQRRRPPPRRINSGEQRRDGPN
jgi:CRP-like cAMP-binding protein